MKQETVDFLRKKLPNWCDYALAGGLVSLGALSILYYLLFSICYKSQGSWLPVFPYANATNVMVLLYATVCVGLMVLVIFVVQLALEISREKLGGEKNIAWIFHLLVCILAIHQIIEQQILTAFTTEIIYVLSSAFLSYYSMGTILFFYIVGRLISQGFFFQGHIRLILVGTTPLIIELCNRTWYLQAISVSGTSVMDASVLSILGHGVSTIIMGCTLIAILFIIRSKSKGYVLS
ncbi:MAG: hypothetical protein WC974_05950 [Thermoplasmata archaeon]